MMSTSSGDTVVYVLEVPSIELALADVHVDYFSGEIPMVED